MSTLQITINGVSKDVSEGTPVSALLAEQSRRIQKEALAARINGRLVDLSHALQESGELTFILPDSAEGLDILRHSTSHLMAHAVSELFPDAQVGIGPVIEDGF